MKTIWFVIGFLLSWQLVQAQAIDKTEIKSKIAAYKNDAKGPYQQIMWFCPDGSKVPPRERCPEPGGVQRATYKAWVENLAKSNHIYLGQILATTDVVKFLDAENQYSRVKQYQLENYLEGIDNGWIQQKAKFYRGAFQDEDENEWGEKFLKWTLEEKSLDTSNYFLLRQWFKNIPHKTENSNIRKVRALSLEVADSIPSFMNIRVKIHGQPEASDIESVIGFKQKNISRISPDEQAKLDELIREMKIMFRPVDWASLANFSSNKALSTETKTAIQAWVNEINSVAEVNRKIEQVAKTLLETRQQILASEPKDKYVLLDFSVKTEEMIFRELPNWTPTDLASLLQKNYVLSMAAAGAGYIELWEWETIAPLLKPSNTDELLLGKLTEQLNTARGVVEWSTGMIRANYGKEITLFESFEPLASGFADDLIRSSVLLQLGQSVGKLSAFLVERSSGANHVFDLSNQGQFRGLNPGFAKGKLVVTDNPEETEISSNNIYVFNHPPSDLKPVAGIATVSEGNMVSHVQLLARNLGIPNTVLSMENMDDLRKFEGQEVFYAVTPSGNVTMKLTENMTDREKKLFEVSTREERKIRVGTEKLELGQTTVLNLRDVDAKSSGKLCGPKAANLGQLKLMFPDYVVEGLVIPFGIFKQHMDQPMPGQNETYWEFLNKAFAEAAELEKSNSEKEEVDSFILKKLETLRNAIQEMPFLPGFEADLKLKFAKVLGKEIGSLPVFLRSDTNMEDLKDFTGAGLNLTLFNVVDTDKILKGIKQVWASPYSERSFRWRQSFLLNPENVYPSILVIPSVDVEYSGVLITKGVNNGKADDLTIAFSRGAGGAVDGQAAESYLLEADDTDHLLSPAREPSFNTLPATGGTGKAIATFEIPILKETNLTKIREFSKQLKQKMTETKGMEGPFDVELGFLHDKLWLFQVRPFVENKNAAGADYLDSISAKPDEKKMIPLSDKL